MPSKPYYLSLFLLQDHKHWRAHLGKDRTTFHKHMSQNTKVVARKVFRIEPETGKITEEPA